jgi:flagellar biosynthetic protein FliS
MNPIAKYKTASASNPNVVHQLMFVFDEIIKLLYLAQKSIEEKDYETKFKTISKVTDIFYNLRSGINEEKGGDIIKLLDNYYVSAIGKLEQINIKSEDPADVDQIIKSLNVVKDSIKDSAQRENIR